MFSLSVGMESNIYLHAQVEPLRQKQNCLVTKPSPLKFDTFLFQATLNNFFLYFFTEH